LSAGGKSRRGLWLGGQWKAAFGGFSFVPSVGGLATLDVALWQILLQKSFWGGERKFLEPLMRFMRDDVRDHIVSSKIDHGPP
jgi:hypothetical protein